MALAMLTIVLMTIVATMTKDKMELVQSLQTCNESHKVVVDRMERALTEGLIELDSLVALAKGPYRGKSSSRGTKDGEDHDCRRESGSSGSTNGETVCGTNWQILGQAPKGGGY